MLQAAGALAGLAPFIAVVELGRALLAPGPVDEHAVRTAVAVAVAGLLARALLTGLSGGLAHLLDSRLRFSLRMLLAETLGRAPVGRYARRGAGEIGSVVQTDVDQLHHLVAHTPGEFTSAVVVPVASLAYLAAVDWRLTLIALLPPLLGLALYSRLMTPPRRQAEQEVGEAMGHISAGAVEFVEGIAVVKTFGGGDRAHRRYREAADAFADSFMKYVTGGAGPAAQAAAVLSPPFVLLVVLLGGGGLVTARLLPPADLLPFLLLSMALTAPVAALGHGMDTINAAANAATRIRALLSVPPLPEPAQPLTPQGSRVELRDVSFSYEPAHPVLHHIDLILEPGTVTALVGPSGAGKSTLAHLLSRYFDPTSGTVLLGGVDLRRIPGRTLHANVSVVSQDVRLLRAAVAENIAVAAPTTDRAAVVDAARAVGLHDRIQALPHGYDTVIGEDTGLSGGEAQRLSIARALLADAPVLVLDEAMAFADAGTEAEVRRALDALAPGRTQLVIVHRLETAARADRIVVMDGGRIVESGTFEELSEQDGRFAALWRARYGDTAARPYSSAEEGTHR
ncbi:ABC transporter [Streptomyces sp. CB02923]|nr:ABC transporter [Streptomyces sp. CB02923]